MPTALALLAFLALRPRKGWLRREAPPAQQVADLPHKTPLVPACDPRLLSQLPDAELGGTSAGGSSSLPLSYISSLGPTNDHALPHGGDHTPS